MTVTADVVVVGGGVVGATTFHLAARAISRMLLCERHWLAAGAIRKSGRWYVRAPMRLSRASSSLRPPAPAPGEHTDEVQREYGHSEVEIRQLEDTGMVEPKETVVA